jgi:GNAT superfamily N-acetyltransferase
VSSSGPRQLVGFAKGRPHDGGGPISRRLNKIYLRRRYHRLGLGRRLLREVALALSHRSITSMLRLVRQTTLERVYEAMGGERIIDRQASSMVLYGGRLRRL